MPNKLLILETHPIQYRAPIFQAYERMFPGEIEVVYASDFSVRGYRDREFGSSFAWDTPLMEGYPCRVLDNLRDGGVGHWRGISGRGIAEIIRRSRPNAILLHSLAYEFSWTAYLTALRLRVPVWLRVETQDQAFERSSLRSLLRHAAYRLAYSGVDRAFYIGELNREHLMAHGIAPRRLLPARYCTPDPLQSMTKDQKQALRATTRETLGFTPENRVIAFFGKFINKKNPELILSALSSLQGKYRSTVACLMVGSGELEAALRRESAALESATGIPTVYAGFVNQQALPGYYLASDIVVLPSRRMGETWGLVINEAMQAGCAIAASDAVGCTGDYRDWERVRVFPSGDSRALALSLSALLEFPRDLEWATESMRAYSVDACAIELHEALIGLR